MVYCPIGFPEETTKMVTRICHSCPGSVVPRNPVLRLRGQLLHGHQPQTGGLLAPQDQRHCLLRSVHFSSVQLKMLSMRLGKPLRAPPYPSDISPMLPLKQFHRWSDGTWPFQGRLSTAASFCASLLQAINSVIPLALSAYQFLRMCLLGSVQVVSKRSRKPIRVSSLLSVSPESQCWTD